MKNKADTLFQLIPHCPSSLSLSCDHMLPGADHLTVTANVSNTNVNGSLHSFWELTKMTHLSYWRRFIDCQPNTFLPHSRSFQSLIVDQTPDGGKNKTPRAILSSFTTAISRTNDGFRCVIKQETHKPRWLFFSNVTDQRGTIIKPQMLVLFLRNKQLLKCLQAALRGACQTGPLESFHKAWFYQHCSAVTHIHWQMVLAL